MTIENNIYGDGQDLIGYTPPFSPADPLHSEIEQKRISQLLYELHRKIWTSEEIVKRRVLKYLRVVDYYHSIGYRVGIHEEFARIYQGLLFNKRQIHKLIQKGENEK